MMPINQITIGGDPLLGTPSYNIEEQLRQLEARRQTLESMKQLNPQAIQQSVLWDSIDSEIKVLSQDQLSRLFENQEYIATYTRIQELVNTEIINLVKARIENTTEGKQLLQEQLNIIRKMKPTIIEETNREVELFKRFREYSKNNPNITYEEFIKAK
jgi:hypothetical protein